MTTSISYKVFAAVWAAIKTVPYFFRMLFISLCVQPVLARLPEKYIPKHIPKAVMKKDVSLNLSLHSLEVMWRERYEKLLCPVKPGMKAPNVDVLTMKKDLVKLLDFQKPGRTLIVNFGSCT